MEGGQAITLVEVDDDAMTELGIDLLSDKHALSYEIINR